MPHTFDVVCTFYENLIFSGDDNPFECDTLEAAKEIKKFKDWVFEIVQSKVNKKPWGVVKQIWVNVSDEDEDYVDSTHVEYCFRIEFQATKAQVEPHQERKGRFQIKESTKERLTEEWKQHLSDNVIEPIYVEFDFPWVPIVDMEGNVVFRPSAYDIQVNCVEHVWQGEGNSWTEWGRFPEDWKYNYADHGFEENSADNESEPAYSLKRVAKGRRFKALRSDAKIGNALKTIEQVFGLPKGSVQLVNSTGRRTRSDKTIGSLLKDFKKDGDADR